MRNFTPLKLQPLLAGLCGAIVLSAQAQTVPFNTSDFSTVNPAAPSSVARLAPELRAPLPAGQVGAPLVEQEPATAKPTARKFPPLEPTEYQRFVRETTGRNLALFGYKLFAQDGFPSLQNVPVPADYVVGPGDEILLKLWGAVDADLRLKVDRNGQISIPRVGTLNVAGLKAAQLEPTLKAQIGRTYANFQLSATLGQLRSMQVFVVGQARQPGAYTVSSLSTLISALFESGGPAANGSLRNIQLKRDGQLVSTLDLYQFITQGDKSADARLLPGDVIVIPPVGPRVALIGALDNPAIYELGHAEEPLARVLGYAGGTRALTSPHKVLIERITPAQTRAPRSVEERALDAAGLQSSVRDGDVVTLFEIRPEFANAVTLRGNVAAPLRYAYRPGMRVADLIPEREALIQPDYYTRKNAMVQFEAGSRVSGERIASEVKNLLDEINWDYAAIERLDSKDVRSQLLPFNLGRAVRDKDPAHNLALQPGDVVTVFGVKDLPVPLEKRTQFVRIAGEVKVPGIYQVQPGETLPELLQRAGGFSANAYPYGLVFSRESTRAQQQVNLDQAVRRMEADIGSRSATSLQNLPDQDKTLAQAQQETQRLMLARLRSLKASGRIALEMQPDAAELPAIALEDGDQITVPHKPGFVGVFGAVMAETSFIYRADASVRDYLDRAGLTADAEDDAALIIRADGSVESNPAVRSWVSAGGSFMARKLQPGDSVFVPEKVDRRTAYTRFIQGAKDWTAILYQFGLGAAGLKTLRN